MSGATETSVVKLACNPAHKAGRRIDPTLIEAGFRGLCVEDRKACQHWRELLDSEHWSAARTAEPAAQGRDGSMSLLSSIFKIGLRTIDHPEPALHPEPVRKGARVSYI